MTNGGSASGGGSEVGGPERHWPPERHLPPEKLSSRAVFGHFPKRAFGGGGDEQANRRGYVEFNVGSVGRERGNPMAIQASGGGASSKVWW